VAKKKRRNLAAMQRDIVAREASVASAHGAGQVARDDDPSNWEVYECIVNDGWNQPGALVQLAIARRSPRGRMVAGIALVDLGCLGVKNAFARRTTVEKYLTEIRVGVTAFGAARHISLDLAARIVREAIAYARSLGFEPHRDFRQFEPLLAGGDADAAPEEIPFGEDGKPLYISGPHDNVNHILATLNRTVGEGNYHYLIGDQSLAGFGDFDALDDWDER
jgi:hypothetical protein